MARKTASASTKKPTRSQRAAAAVSTKIKLPQTWRVVTARTLRPRKQDARNAPVREVPEIRLGGAWLERIGFLRGTRYLVSADRSVETIYLQVEQKTVKTRRRSG